jgi:hypothetical protein
MLLFSSVNLFLLACAIWALQQKEIGREIKKQVCILSLSCASFSFLFFLVPLFDFFEATRSDFAEAFFRDGHLVQLGLLSFVFSLAHLIVSVVALNRFLNSPGKATHLPSPY